MYLVIFNILIVYAQINLMLKIFVIFIFLLFIEFILII